MFSWIKNIKLTKTEIQYINGAVDNKDKEKRELKVVVDRHNVRVAIKTRKEKINKIYGKISE